MDLGQYSIAAAQPGLAVERILTLPTPLPPLRDQIAIVRFLDHAERRIRRYIRAKQKLIKLFEEHRERIVHHAVTCGTDSSVQVSPSSIGLLGHVPNHWEVKRLRHISPRIGVGLVINPSTYFIDESIDGGVPMLLGNNIVPGGFRLQQVRKISAASNAKLQASRLNAGDVVVVRVGAPGVAAVVPTELDQANCASVVIVRRAPSYNSEWLAFAFNSQTVRDQVNVVKYGAAQKQFNVSHVVDFWFAVPPRVEQDSIVEYLRGALASIAVAARNAHREIALVREYRTRLIADVVTGKLDVREAAARLPANEEECEPLDDADTVTYSVELDEGIEFSEEAEA